MATTTTLMTEDDTLTFGDALPGFEYPITKLFV